MSRTVGNLTDKQRRFAKAFVGNGGRRIRAAVEAGYSPRYARMQAYELLRTPKVLRALLDYSLAQAALKSPGALRCIEALAKTKSEHVALQASREILNRIPARPSLSETGKSSGTSDVCIDLS